MLSRLLALSSPTCGCLTTEIRSQRRSSFTDTAMLEDLGLSVATAAILQYSPQCLSSVRGSARRHGDTGVLLERNRTSLTRDTVQPPQPAPVRREASAPCFLLSCIRWSSSSQLHSYRSLRDRRSPHHISARHTSLLQDAAAAICEQTPSTENNTGRHRESNTTVNGISPS